MSSHNTKPEYEYARGEYHDPSCWNRGHESYETKEKEKNSKKYPHSNREKHDTLIPWMDTYSIKYFSKFFFIRSVGDFDHVEGGKENPLRYKGF